MTVTEKTNRTGYHVYMSVSSTHLHKTSAKGGRINSELLVDFENPYNCYTGELIDEEVNSFETKIEKQN